LKILIKEAHTVVQSKERILRNTDVAIEDGTIAHVGKAPSDFNPEIKIEGRNKKLIVLPGLMNSHIHTDETLNMNVIPDNVSHVPWFRDWTLPYYHEMNKEDFYWSSLLSCMLMLECGTTCYADSANVEPYLSAKAAEKTGIRGFVAKWTSDLGKDFSLSLDQCIKENENILKLNKQKGRIRAIASTIGVNRTSNELYVAIGMLARKHNVVVTSHEASGREDVSLCLKRTGKRPVENLYSIGFLSNKTVLSHLTHISDREVELVSKTNTAVVSCPYAEMKKGKGFTRYGKIHKLVQKNVRICIGTDTCNSSNHLNVIKASLLAALITKDLSMNPALADVGKTLEWITEKPYSTFGLKGGRIEKGNIADLSIFELEFGFYSKGALQELFYGNNQKCIATIVDGELVYHKGKFKGIKKEHVLNECIKRAERIHKRLSL
jgi:5-methylthioadenosine/S-adenosylhomocysteine deaminase